MLVSSCCVGFVSSSAVKAGSIFALVFPSVFQSFVFVSRVKYGRVIGGCLARVIGIFGDMVEEWWGTSTQGPMGDDKMKEKDLK